MKKILVTLELRVPEDLTPGAVTHRLMDFAGEQDWELDAASATFPTEPSKKERLAK